MREQFIGQFDMTFYTPEYLYAEKSNGEVLWYGHMIGVDKNVPQPATRNPLSAQAATKGLAQPSTGKFSATQTRSLARRPPADSSTALGGSAGRVFRLEQLHACFLDG
jgi:hypothetical protein